MSRQDVAVDRVLALTLKAGAYTAFALVLCGLVLQWAMAATPWGGKVATAGLLVLLATPVLRIVVAGVQFFRERDLKYALVSLGVLGILVLAYFLGIQM
jgi:ABC-type Fe3+ transport system permease subunit